MCHLIISTNQSIINITKSLFVLWHPVMQNRMTHFFMNKWYYIRYIYMEMREPISYWVDCIVHVGLSASPRHPAQLIQKNAPYSMVPVQNCNHSEPVLSIPHPPSICCRNKSVSELALHPARLHRIQIFFKIRVYRNEVMVRYRRQDCPTISSVNGFCIEICVAFVYIFFSDCSFNNIFG